MRLSHNMFSLNIYKNYKNTLSDNAKALNNVSTGSKLSSAADNPNKIGKSETLKIQVLTYDAASKNIQDTNSLIQTFDSSLQEMNNNLVRMKELAVSAGSGALAPDDKKIIQSEIDSIKANINELANNTEFNGVKLSDSTLTGENVSTIKTSIGNMDDENMDIPFYNVSAENLGISTVNVNDIDAGNEAIDKAVEMVGKVRSKYGSIQKRLEGTADYLSSKSINTESAQSRIGDADIAEEMMKYSTSQILIQSSIGLMAQSNNFPKDALKILENVK
ncbi:flagellin [Clostridium gelidum]|uniref:Flagellin n=1 Tax=Clostridium gelidum TaxID=704125 RepID=A0ABM7TBX6_9CLOT|nr:flagellin [Clostridium gelidum]BCZ48600.1 flagellin [Clostridium gelidum]